ncbi:DUF1573 domain-containing protein [Mucilaginibacter sp. BJC16-A38]|uniref:DUF1573 domain-containing protein n=1 Tax=Mucilaginibacter phenanthrenivorans TaxID=1234842 RepID=UPI002156FB28|nr:DUF1573 domain-containing protein [Mucilaginibacter phenanthrenivorans]MCR8560375.1 DUF1573 domain-containing protein [Mucilaginibacter phenanthrenivorans]
MTNKIHTKLFLVAVIALMSLASCHLNNSKQVTTTDPSTLGAFKFDDDEYDFGKIKDGDTVSHTFKYTNIGKAPLIIYDISTGCGCTVARWTNTPVLPGKTGVIVVRFSKHHDAGIHTKLAVIKANIKEVYYALKIMALVEK